MGNKGKEKKKNIRRLDKNTVNVLDNLGQTVLHIAAKAGMMDVCDAILGCSGFTAGAVRTNAGESALEALAARGLEDACVRLVEGLDEAGLNEKQDGDTLLIWLVHRLD